MNKIFFRIAFVIVLAVLLMSCVTARKVNYMQKPGMGISAYKDSVSFEEYMLKPDDRLYIQVYSLDDRMNDLFNSGARSNNLVGISQGSGPYFELYTYLVDDDGNIALPYIGKVKVDGKTVREVRNLLEEELAAYFYLNNVDVDVRVVGRFYSIIGQSASGKFPLSREKMNIFQALAQAGDIGTYGNRSKIKILRETDSGTKIMEFDVRSADIINSEFYYVEPNDVIYIQNRGDQVFGITNVANLVGLGLTTFSFGLFIYNLIIMTK